MALIEIESVNIRQIQAYVHAAAVDGEFRFLYKFIYLFVHEKISIAGHYFRNVYRTASEYVFDFFGFCVYHHDIEISVPNACSYRLPFPISHIPRSLEPYDGIPLIVPGLQSECISKLLPVSLSFLVESEFYKDVFRYIEIVRSVEVVVETSLSLPLNYIHLRSIDLPADLIKAVLFKV